MTDHTPTPWKYEPWHIQEGPSAVLAPEGWIICTTSSDENAAFIVKAVNSHDALVKHLDHLATVCCDEDALRLLESIRDPVSRSGEPQ